MSWIRFQELPSLSGGRTLRWAVESLKPPAEIGLVKWYSAWRKYAFFPSNHTVFEEDCLREIAQFCEQLTRNHRHPRLDPIKEGLAAYKEAGL